MRFKLGTWSIPVVVDKGASEDVFGYYDDCPTPRVVVTKAGAVGRNFPLTVLHELLHAVSDVYGLGLSEAKVRGLEQGLGSMILSNPKGFRSLIDKLVKSEACAADPVRKPKRKVK